MPSWNKTQGLFFFLFKRISQKIKLYKILNLYFSPLINIFPCLKGSLPRYFPSCQTSNAQYFKFPRRENTSVTKRKFRKGSMCKRVSPGYSSLIAHPKAMSQAAPACSCTDGKLWWGGAPGRAQQCRSPANSQCPLGNHHPFSPASISLPLPTSGIIAKSG